MLRNILTLALLYCCGLFVPTAGAVDLIWVHEDIGPGFDQGWIDFLGANGHNVEKRIYTELDAAGVAEMSASPLVIFSRNTNSGNYVEGDEIQLWNSVTAPVIVMTPFTLRSSRWKMVDATGIKDVEANLEALDVAHPIFDGVALDGDNQVDVWDETALGPDDNIDLVDTTDFGNATVIAQEAGTGIPWIAEWDAGTEFYAGSVEIAGGRRLFLSGGSDDDPNSWGGKNFTAAGDQILLNAIQYMAVPEPASALTTLIGILTFLGYAACRRR